MADTEKTAIAAHLYVSLRRVANRVIDIEWMAQNEEYARAIIKLVIVLQALMKARGGRVIVALIFGDGAAHIQR